MAESTSLEPAVPLSESKIWEIQRRYFEHAGQSAWSKGVVPNYVTTNSFIARAYARTIAAWAEDLAATEPGLPAGPIRVIELGAGGGRLGFLVSLELAQISRDRGLPPFQVVITDFTDANVDAWCTHPDLAEAFAAGHLDCARFDADDPAPLVLRKSGETLDALGGPIAILANYVVDTLRQDAFAVEEGVLHEIRVRATLPADAKRSADDPEVSRDVTLKASRRPASLPFYDDPGLDGLLQRYLGVLSRAEVLVPVGMIRAVRSLRARSDGRVCMLMGDKGYRAPRDMEGRRLGQLVKHGSFSVMANLDAVAHELGGTTLTHPNRYTRFTIVAAATGGGEQSRFRAAYRDEIAGFGPAEYHRGYKILRQATPKEATTPLPQILLMLRLSAFDPVVFARWGQDILDQAAEVNPAIQQDLLSCIQQLLPRTYALSPSDDVRFIAGRVLFRIERYVEAAEQFERVTQATPDRRAAWYNLGLCKERTQDTDGARIAFERALEVDPTYERAAAALDRVR